MEIARQAVIIYLLDGGMLSEQIRGITCMVKLAVEYTLERIISMLQKSL